MKKLIRKALKTVYNGLGDNDLHSDFEKDHNDIWNATAPYTMTSKERIFGLIEAVKYISKNNVKGDIVECGVWKGGSMLAAAKTLIANSDTDRRLFLYDTFEGMPAPTEHDIDVRDTSAESQMVKMTKSDGGSEWCYSTLSEVTGVINISDYPKEKVNYIVGKVEDTIPANIPEKIALLRLDTDWYESTKHELIHLFPRLEKGGVLIIDDYGFWKGARKAVDEYFSENNIQILLNRMDNTGRIAIKQ
jgi:hypothetical protein